MIRLTLQPGGRALIEGAIRHEGSRSNDGKALTVTFDAPVVSTSTTVEGWKTERSHTAHEFRTLAGSGGASGGTLVREIRTAVAQACSCLHAVHLPPDRAERHRPGALTAAAGAAPGGAAWPLGVPLTVPPGSP